MTANKTAIHAFGIEHSFGDSLNSEKTVVNEVTVLSMNKKIEVKDGSFHITDTEVNSSAYEITPAVSVLQHFDSWRKRLLGIQHAHELHLRCDVTGGVDSRSVLGLLLRSGGGSLKY